MGNLLSNLLAMSIAGSVVAGLMLLLRPVTAKTFSARWQYGIGKIAIVFFLIPVSLFARKFPLAQPIMESYPAEPATIQNALPSHAFMDAMGTLMEKHFTFEIEAVLFIWLVGAMVFAGWNFYCYRRFSKQLRADSFPVPEDTAAVLLSSCKTALGIHGEVKLMLNPKIKSPMLVGLCRPMILLPVSKISEIDLNFVLTHELMHLKRKDLWVKMFVLIAGTLHWFNPFVHVLRKDISTWGELSCDEALATEMSHEERKLYGEAILNTLDNHSGINTAFCSSLCESRKHIERRLTMLLNVKKTKKHIAVFAATAVVAIASIATTVSALAAENENILKLEGARNITIVSADGTAITYDKYGNATETKNRGNHPYLALTDEQKAEKEKLDEQYRFYLEAGIPAPQEYLDALNALYGITPYVYEGSDVSPDLTYEEILERIKLYEEKGLSVPEAYLNAVNKPRESAAIADQEAIREGVLSNGIRYSVRPMTEEEKEAFKLREAAAIADQEAAATEE